MRTKSEVCYGYDGSSKVVLRFQTEYQRRLWISNGHPDYPEDYQTLDASHHLVRRVKEWKVDGRGIEVGVL